MLKAPLFLLLSLMTVSSCSPELGETPFRCAATGKKCPDDFICDTASNVCVRENRPKADMGGSSVSDTRLPPSKDGPVFLDGALVRVVDTCVDNASEPNNTGDTANPLQNLDPPVEKRLIPDWEICYEGDVDHHRIDLIAGQQVEAKILFKHDKGDLDMAVVNPDGIVFQESRSETDNESVSFSVNDSGAYTIGIFGFGPATNSYDIELSIR